MTVDPQSGGRKRQSVALNRRSLIKASAGAAGGLGLFGPSALPLISRRSAAAQGDALTFWQFYAPGGRVETQTTWFGRQ
jgi:multiple sugar transport system substrate-binding protein